jgi:hypothetical protein
VLNRHGQLEYVLEPPLDVNLINPSIQKQSEIVEKYGDLKNYIRKTQIKCKVINSSVYVDATGHVFPCCWVGSRVYPWQKPPKTGMVWKFINQNGGLEALNGRIGIENVYNSSFFQQIKNLWDTENQLDICGKTCGVDFDSIGTQTQTKQL